MTNNITLKLIRKLIEGDAFSFLSVPCPECENIGDPDYTCTSCWHQGGGSYLVANIINQLLNDSDNNLNHEPIPNEILNELMKNNSFSDLFVDCPDCLIINDESYLDYTCKTCGCQDGGYFKVDDVISFLIKNNSKNN